MTNALKQRWDSLCSELAVDSHESDIEFERLAAAYNEAQRVYHTLTHIEQVFAELTRFTDPAPALSLAVFYHDVVYKSGSSNNEEKSAIWAQNILTRWSQNEALIARCMTLIRATQSHQLDTEDEQGCLFLDADMAILGAPTDIYHNYAEMVRQEHKRFPGILYRAGRRKFLKQLLGSERIFLSDPFYRRYEQQARLNLSEELERLSR